MSLRFKSSILPLLIGFLITSCQPIEVATISRTEVVTGQDLVSVYLLADHLGLKVTETTNTYVTLRDSTNSVLIFTHSGGQFYVNGKLIGLVGQIEKINDKLFVPESIEPQIRAAMRTTSPVRYPADLSGCVVIDPGHGGKDTGAISSSGCYEKTVNLQVAKKVEYLLKERGLDVIMTRIDDSFIDLNQRAELANRNNAKLFVSIHADSTADSSTRGFTVYVARSASRRSHSAGNAIARAMTETGLGDNGVQEADYRVLVNTKCPAVLVELGYLSNPREAWLLVDNAFQNRLAQAISKGICEAIGTY